MPAYQIRREESRFAFPNIRARRLRHRGHKMKVLVERAYVDELVEEWSILRLPVGVKQEQFMRQFPGARIGDDAHEWRDSNAPGH